VEIDGQDAKLSDLQEGQEVRASFNQVNGEDVAVQIQAGHGMSSSSSGWVNDPAQQGGSTPQGDSTQQGTGSYSGDTSSPTSGSTHSNSPNGPAKPESGSSGRNY
jgi:hypothetical protein